MSLSVSALRKLSGEVVSSAAVSSPNIFRKALNSVVSFYEECIGLADVHKARSDVTKVY